jgi:hypothetical protein
MEAVLRWAKMAYTVGSLEMDDIDRYLGNNLLLTPTLRRAIAFCKRALADAYAGATLAQHQQGFYDAYLVDESQMPGPEEEGFGFGTRVPGGFEDAGLDAAIAGALWEWEEDAVLDYFEEEECVWDDTPNVIHRGPAPPPPTAVQTATAVPPPGTSAPQAPPATESSSPMEGIDSDSKKGESA